ncbi:ABC transporter permease [Gordonia sp. 852002-51296_SCH5728562-b]|uniref:ABC transporter permease n=1 Tax=Gordonia sp. 852002-51296_SCH5728562-b TaxID=1834101 RepID=UPI0007EBA6C8|nr:ABC transporter permease [Gordonia sp. 852002-51296_SCH5728562-b]OBA38036.1 molybdenum ABC transporter permease subunit [Gordonia sp. 852002-51296_SCH5728562-b]
MRRIPLWVYVPAVIGICFILIGPLAIIVRMPWGDFWGSITSQASLDALRLGVLTAVVSTLICVILGVPIAFVFARFQGIAVRVLRAVVLLPLVLPPVVGGIALLYALGRYGLVGQYLDRAGIQLAFTTAGVVVAQTFVAMPFLVLSVEGALRSAGADYEQIAATLGASPTRTLWKVTLPLVFPALTAGAVLAFARALGEFGATITFAGNLPGTTQTAPLKIYLDSINDPIEALPLSLVLMVVALFVVVAVHLRRSPAVGA